MSWKTTVKFDEMTWADLRAFVELGKDRPDDAPVLYDVEDFGDHYKVVGLMVTWRPDE
jgi:hypothetical protein